MEAPNGSKDPAILKLRISGTIKQSSDKNQSNECDYCKDIFRVGYKRHVGLCKLYSNYINKIDTGLQCKICFTCLPKKSQMFRHIKLHHSKDLENLTVGYKRHVELCKLYSNYINKIDIGLQCKICFTCLPKKEQMFRHIELHHSKDLKSPTIHSKEKKSAESASDIPYLNRKIYLLRYQIFEFYYFCH